MNAVNLFARRRRTVPGWLRHSSVTSCILSLAAHLCIAGFVVFTKQDCEVRPIGIADELSREIGILVESRADRAQDSARPPNLESNVVTSTDEVRPTIPIHEHPPAVLMLPTLVTHSQLGAAFGVPSGVDKESPPIRETPDCEEFGPGGNHGGVPGAAILGTFDFGMTFVFVIDASGSMFDNSAMEVAKKALASSVQALDPSQQFLIVHYDHAPHLINLHKGTKPSLTLASELNKRLARQQIAGIQSGTGTNHLLPLEIALRMRPDVIFFLTDATDPPLDPKDLEKIRMTNGGRTRIHSIQFGAGSDQGRTYHNFARKLADQNGGTYRCQNLSQLRRPK